MAVNHSYRCAKEQYAYRRDPETHQLDEVPPELLGLGVIHALEVDPLPTMAAVIAPQRAVCGCFVRVVYPVSFRTDLALSCGDCVVRLEGTNRHVDEGPGFTLSPEARQALDRQREAGQ